MEDSCENGVRAVVQRVHTHSQENRRSRRLQAQSGKRNLSSQEFNDTLTEKELKTLSNLCKSGKLTVPQFRELSKVDMSGKL